MSNVTTTPQGATIRRPLIFVVLGFFLLAAASLLVYDRLQVHTTIAPRPTPYKYTVQEAVHYQVHYNKSSFFGDAPDASNTAYLSKLTSYITSQLHYHYQASEVTDLAYQYSANAVIRATSGSESTDQGVSTVWSKQYQLLQPVSGTKSTTALTFDPTIQIPFSDYKQAMDQFRNTLEAPLNGEMVVTYNVQVSGKVRGTPFTDTKVSIISTSLDQQVYQLSEKFDKIDHHDVFPAKTTRLVDTITAYELPVAIALYVFGASYIIYGFRRQIFKTPYMRELERIYRYHDGIIIRASRPASLAGKNIIPVESFDDLLNLEEEIKAPIVASPAGATATQFTISRDDTVYVFTLGELAQRPAVPTTNAQLALQRRPEHRGKVSG